MIKKLVLGAVLGISLSGCEVFGADVWEGHIYPDISNLNNSIYIGEYSTLNQCRSSARSELYDLVGSDWSRVSDYECGLNCKPLFPDIPNSVRVCEKINN